MIKHLSIEYPFIVDIIYLLNTFSNSFYLSGRYFVNTVDSENEPKLMIAILEQHKSARSKWHLYNKVKKYTCDHYSPLSWWKEIISEDSLHIVLVEEMRQLLSVSLAWLQANIIFFFPKNHLHHNILFAMVKKILTCFSKPIMLLVICFRSYINYSEIFLCFCSFLKVKFNLK